MSSRNRDTISRLYAGLDRADGEAMASCYAPDASFSDPIFPDLRGERVGDMWRMLCERSTDLSVELPDHHAEGDTGSAHWIATYTFSTGRPVVNDIRAEFRFTDDGLIREHRDSFSFWRWSRQALGPVGWAMGWTPLLLAATRRKAGADLDRFSAAR